MRHLSGIALSIAVAGTAYGQAYPTKPVRLIIEVPAGSVAEVAIRQAGQEMAGRLGQPLVQENRVGANGIIAMDACAKAPPDGYTLCVVAPSIVWNVHLNSKIPYDTEKDFKPVARLFFLIEALLASPKVPAGTIKELQALAVAKPDTLNFATLGTASQPDVFRQWLGDRWGTQLVAVPYKGAAQILPALMAGDVDLTQLGLGNAAALFPSGKIRVYAVGGTQRQKALPNVPTMREAGLADAPGSVFWGIVSPSGVPDAIVARVSGELRRQFTDAKFVEILESRYLEPAFQSPAEFGNYLREQRDFAGTLVRKYKLQGQ